MAAEPSRTEIASGEHKRQEPAQLLLAFAIGALVGIGLAAIWVPERRRRRLPAALSRRYQRMRKASTATLDEIRKAGRPIAGEFREELGASLEAAREELKDMARHQLDQVHQALRREQRKLGGSR
jgi:flagellar biosynthesis/type III secretory pathway M-ring protein FliF/YscJ